VVLIGCGQRAAVQTAIGTRWHKRLMKAVADARFRLSASAFK
jgi:hypothetical protein